MIKIDSSSIYAVDYVQHSLIVVFKKGMNVYAYTGVSKRMYDEFMACESKGKWFNLHIRPHYHAILIKNYVVNVN